MGKNCLFCLYSGQTHGADLRRLHSSDSQFHLLASMLSLLGLLQELYPGPMIIYTASVRFREVCVCVCRCVCVCVCVLVADIPLDIARPQTAESRFVRWMTMDFVFSVIYH